MKLFRFRGKWKPSVRVKVQVGMKILPLMVPVVNTLSARIFLSLPTLPRRFIVKTSGRGGRRPVVVRPLTLLISGRSFRVVRRRTRVPRIRVSRSRITW